MNYYAQTWKYIRVLKILNCRRICTKSKYRDYGAVGIYTFVSWSREKFLGIAGYGVLSNLRTVRVNSVSIYDFSKLHHKNIPI